MGAASFHAFNSGKRETEKTWFVWNIILRNKLITTRLLEIIVLTSVKSQMQIYVFVIIDKFII